MSTSRQVYEIDGRRRLPEALPAPGEDAAFSRAASPTLLSVPIMALTMKRMQGCEYGCRPCSETCRLRSWGGQVHHQRTVVLQALWVDARRNYYGRRKSRKATDLLSSCATTPTRSSARRSCQTRSVARSVKKPKHPLRRHQALVWLISRCVYRLIGEWNQMQRNYANIEGMHDL